MVLVRFQKLYLIPLPFYPFYLSKNCMYTYIPIFGLPSHQGHHRALSRVPSAIQEVIVELSILHMPACKLSHFSHVQLCNPMDCSSPYPPSMGFPRQEYWSGLPFPSPGDLPGPGIEPGFPTLQADSLLSEPPGKPSRHYLQARACYGHFLKRRLVSSKEMKTLFTSPAEN